MFVELARRAERLGFSTLATIGRVAYPTFEELVTLGAAAAVTERIGLMTDVLLAATREPVLLAKQAATLDVISGGRFVLGIGSGGREDDFTVTGSGFHDRGRRIDSMLELMRRAWRGEAVPGTEQAVTPRPHNGESVPMMFGGRHPKVVERVVRYGIGYTLGGGTPEALKSMIEQVNPAWEAAGREGRPRYRALSYFALGEDVREEAEENLRAYYGGFGDRVWAGVVKTPEEARERVEAFRAVGCDELILFVTAASADQADRLAKAIL